jgi:hypothetical protein
LTGQAALTGRAIKNSPIVGGRAIPDRGKAMRYGPVRCVSAEETSLTLPTLAGFPWRRQIKDYDSADLRYHAELLIRFYVDADRNGAAILTWMD